MNDRLNSEIPARRCPELWDPASAWPAGRKLIWAVLAGLVLIAQGPAFLRDSRVTWREGNDFFQDWASARNVLESRRAYLPIAQAIDRYAPRSEGRSASAHIPWNAHPPTSILATMPLGLLDYPKAGLVWNAINLLAMIASLAAIASELRFPVRPWIILPATAISLLCGPIRAEISQGQWNAWLLLALTLAWIAARRGQDSWAGVWVGVAITLKLFPALLLLYFLVQRRWHAVALAFLTALGLSLATAAALGPGAYLDYQAHVIPSLDRFRTGWNNASIAAFWLKNLGTGSTHYGLVVPAVIEAPLLAWTGIAASYALLLSTTCRLLHRCGRYRRSRPIIEDLGFSLAMVAMLLSTPICWDHYLLLLALPLALLWAGLGPSSLQRGAFLLLLACAWVSPDDLWRAGGVDVTANWPDFQDVPPGTHVIKRPLFGLGCLSLHFYVLVAVHVWLAILTRRELAISGQGTRDAA